MDGVDNCDPLAAGLRSHRASVMHIILEFTFFLSFESDNRYKDILFTKEKPSNEDLPKFLHFSRKKRFILRDQKWLCAAHLVFL